MRIIITSGATFCPWDSVRGLTNLSQGTTGANIAEHALLQGHEVDYISSNQTKKPFELKLNPSNINKFAIEELKSLKECYENYTFHESATFDKYLENCLSIPFIETKEKRTVFISAAAVSDYSPIKMDGKISSVKEQMQMEMTKLPKVISEIKKKYPLMPVVGFKLLSSTTSTLNDLIEVAYESLLTSKLALVVANLVDDDFKVVSTVIITPEKGIYPVHDRKDLPRILIEMIEDRLDCYFYKTSIEAPLPLDLNTNNFFKLMKVASDYSLFSCYGSGREGAEFGSIAERVGESVLVTGRGTKKENATEDNVALVNNIVNQNIMISSNGIKGTLNAPVLWNILNVRPEINYIVHSHIYLPKGSSVINSSSPGTVYDYEEIEEIVLSGETMINQVGHGCFILLKKIEDLFDILMQNSIYNTSNAKYYDIAYTRFKKGILERTVERLDFDKDIDVLDLACGTGKSTNELMLLGFKNIDIADASPNMIKMAEKRLGTNQTGIIASFENLDNIKKQYDLITIRQAFSYIEPDKINEFAESIYSKLNKNGHLIFNSFNLLPESTLKRNDIFEENGKLIKTKETNVITKETVCHSQVTDYLDLDLSFYISLYDINVFNQYDLNEIKKIFDSVGFSVVVKVENKSTCLIARKL